MNQNTDHRLPRIAASSYLNTAPLIWSFIHGARRDAVNLLTDTAPARCAEMLARGEVDVALVPVIEYQRLDGVSIVPDVCVGSRSAVRSVVLATKRNNLKKVRRVALDDSSRTSVALVKIIFREFLGFEPEWQLSPPDLTAMLAHNDAALIIGDPAMKIPRDQFRVFDLATLWHDYTGFGFVFAMWMARKDSAEKVRAIDFAAARDEGLAHVEDIAIENEARLGLSRDEVKTYLTENIAFRMGEEMEGGLDRYFELAHKLGLIESAKQLVFIGP
ncbi:MAG TPA: menaquinone biosynthesis protein [Pyrinomonadaceae bacterium]|jgi:chorismate dehydratase|nr:menaquinone biosynthesis protein [Pyrinomonadaceae bacterium]